jgi:hypothetical protein
METSTDIQKIRPAGRHILTIGRDLIKDSQAAIIELVKNAYDADASRVDITFEVSQNRDKLIITVKDDGHGMTQDVVVGKWLVPSTNDKSERKISPKGRVMQGCKGVGRYAASILGDDLILKTIDQNNNKTEIYLEWSKFEKSEYLDDVEILLAASIAKEPSSTELIMTGNAPFIVKWTEKNSKQETQLTLLIKELRKLLSPYVICNKFRRRRRRNYKNRTFSNF